MLNLILQSTGRDLIMVNYSSCIILQEMLSGFSPVAMSNEDAMLFSEILIHSGVHSVLQLLAWPTKFRANRNSKRNQRPWWE